MNIRRTFALACLVLLVTAAAAPAQTKVAVVDAVRVLNDMQEMKDLLAAPTHLQWLYRLIGNLRQVFTSEGRRDDLAAMNELLSALRQSQP